MNSDDVQGLLESHNQELTIDGLIEIHEKEQGIEEPESLEPVQSEDRMMEFRIDGSLDSNKYAPHKVALPHINFCTVQSATKLPTGFPKMIPT
ncbi:hypothetical protein TNCV_2629291 [Trichonephila clavipes]|uniref:Uncharacterized protein n=1 Tax=Trichonephila clavipes TaxID=2585209 RepID=A0A8X6VL60_TRICX|nr:hypothetical protein TNCV_2629291 [Trichonephila clavipes]